MPTRRWWRTSRLWISSCLEWGRMATSRRCSPAIRCCVQAGSRPGSAIPPSRPPRLPIEGHLMVGRPELFLEAFAKAGATLIEVQVEATTSLYRTVQTIKELGAKAGVAVNPATPVEDLREILPYVELVNVMTVEPGFGGQKFIPHSPEKIRRVRALSKEIEIEVDGGIDARTAPLVVAAGATVLVAGNSVYGYKGGVAAGIKAIRDSLD